MTIFDPFMFRDELDMLEFRLTQLENVVDFHVLVESPVTHRGYPKPLLFDENRARFARWQHKILQIMVNLPDRNNPWEREHFQRDEAWVPINMVAEDDDLILICDLDEIPSAELLAWDGQGAVTGVMRNFLHAVDWDAGWHQTCVAARARYVRAQGGSLAAIRDRRGEFPHIRHGGWHFSWMGGEEKAREKLSTATCHTELLGSAEGELIRNGLRYRRGQNADNLPVQPVEVDESWPEYIQQRRCPPSWFRPKE